MKVVILCGGLGTRLREETEFRPKPMVNIGNHPILWHIMKIYASYGYNDFIIALGYKGEMIKNYFNHYEIMNSDFTIELGKPHKITLHTSHNESGWRVTLVDTGEKTLKGGRLKRLERYLENEDTFLLTYGDGLSNINIDELVKFHHSHGKTGTVTGVNPTSRFGEMKITGSQIAAFKEKPKNPDGLVNGGFFVFNRKIFDYITEDGDLEVGPLETLAAEGNLMVFKHTGFWTCMDTYRDVEYLNKIWDENKAEWKSW